MKLVLLILALILTLTGCSISPPVNVPGLAAVDAMPGTCLVSSMLVRDALKATGKPAEVVRLQVPTDATRPQGRKAGHAICVFVEKGDTWAYDPQFGQSTRLNLAPSTVFNDQGRIIAATDLIHRRARPRDFHGINWGNGLTRLVAFN